nr:unnamed protein product [Callosobruchus analis]
MDFFTLRLRNVFREKEVRKRSRMLANCAEYHSHVINLALEIDGLQRNVTGHLALVWAVSMGCIANQLMSLSEAIAQELYCIPWHLGSIPEQKVVMFMMMRHRYH